MPRGGARPGAGRKPKGSNVVGFPGGESGPGSAPGDQRALPPGNGPEEAPAPGLAEPPADLSDPEQAVWRAYAPLAIAQRTLVAATVPGFRELCQLMAFKEALALKVMKFGSESALKHFTKLSPRVDAALARFKLTAFGKPADGGAGKSSPAVGNPWAEAAGR